jgi:hypothetical protein
MRNCWRMATAWKEHVEKMYQRVQYGGPHSRSARQTASLDVTAFRLQR